MVLIGGFSSQAIAKKVTGVELLNYGYGNATTQTRQIDPKTVSGEVVRLGGFDIKKTTHLIPLLQGINVGIIYRVKGSPKGSDVNLTFRVLHPPMKRSKFEKSKSSEQISIKCKTGETSFNTYQFTHKYEMVPGTWTFQLIYKNSIIKQVTFNMYKP